MFFLSPQGTHVKMSVSEGMVRRLQTTSFRGLDLKLAGNFFRWGKFDGFMYDDWWREVLASRVHELWLKGERHGTHRLCVKYSEPVGWMGTDGREKYHSDDLESFKPNPKSCVPRVNLGPKHHKSCVLRVRPDRVDLLAPQSRELTLVFELKQEGVYPTAVIRTIYPGYDIGELTGNFGELEKKVVFFDLDHPGA